MGDLKSEFQRQITTLDEAITAAVATNNQSKREFSTTVIDSDGVTITNNSGTLSLPTIIGAGNSFFKTLNFSNNGLINGSEYTVSSTLCSADPTFGGIPDQISTNFEYFGQSQIVTRDPITTNIVTLTSAGFITFESTGSRNGTSVDRFAIPVFTY